MLLNLNQNIIHSYSLV